MNPKRLGQMLSMKIIIYSNHSISTSNNSKLSHPRLETLSNFWIRLLPDLERFKMVSVKVGKDERFFLQILHESVRNLLFQRFYSCFLGGILVDHKARL